MAKSRLQLKNIARISGRIAGVLLAILLVIALMLWSTGALKTKIPPGSLPVKTGKPFKGAGQYIHQLVEQILFPTSIFSKSRRIRLAVVL